MPWRPSEKGEVPTLGFQVLDWISENLSAPDRAEYEPFELYQEQAQFVLRFYELDPRTGRRIIRRGVISRSRGWGKSPFLASIACAEALGPVLFDGWDADGQPVGKPWSEVRTPLVQVAAVSETQTKNTWSPLLEMLDGPVVDNYPGLEPLDTFVNLPRGRIEPVTSSARTIKGNRACFAVLDQTEEWVQSNGGLRLAETMRINAGKIGGTTIESPNAFVPGEGSVAENSAATFKAIIEGRTTEAGVLYDHREAPATTDMSDPESLLLGLMVAYGDSANTVGGHVDLDRLSREIADLDIDPQRARADYLNQITYAQDSWISQPEWAARYDHTKILADRDVVTLGFDGSRSRAKGKPDATALIGCRVPDGHLFEIGVWEAPDGPAQRDWVPPLPEIEAAVAHTFAKFTVVGFYADPAENWKSHVNGWEAKYGGRVKVKATREHPFEWWMTGGRVGIGQRAIEELEGAIRSGDMTHDGSYALTRHILNARRRFAHKKLTLAKEHDYSPRKIDAAVASVLAWQCRLDAVSAGAGRSSGGTVRRIR